MYDVYQHTDIDDCETMEDCDTFDDSCDDDIDDIGHFAHASILGSDGIAPANDAIRAQQPARNLIKFLQHYRREPQQASSTPLSVATKPTMSSSSSSPAASTDASSSGITPPSRPPSISSGIVAAAVVGGIVVLAIIAAITALVLRQRRRRRSDNAVQPALYASYSGRRRSTESEGGPWLDDSDNESNDSHERQRGRPRGVAVPPPSVTLPSAPAQAHVHGMAVPPQRSNDTLVTPQVDAAGQPPPPETAVYQPHAVSMSPLPSLPADSSGLTDPYGTAYNEPPYHSYETGMPEGHDDEPSLPPSPEMAMYANHASPPGVAPPTSSR